MVFSSPIFLLLFLPLVLAVTLLLGQSFRNSFLLAASIIFYAWGGAGHVLLLFVLVVVNWWVGILLDKYEESERYRTKDIIYFICIVFDVSCLVYYKYVNFIIENINYLLSPLNMAVQGRPTLLLPLGISFFTFHLISYVADIHRGVARAQRSPLDFGLYICFFPQLIAGPIIRYHDIADQLSERIITLEKFASGVERFIIGLGKKVLLANPCGQVVDRIFALSAGDLSAPVAWLGIVGYALQLYFDFSGYSDMAIGLARMFGFDYLENFNYPFVSKSIHEFWQRWHISLSNWFRDYFYMPLVMAAARRAQKRAKTVAIKVDDRLQLVVVFFVCGIWHGASWNFAIFGLLHGMFLMLERGRFGRWLGAAPQILSRTYVFLVILVAWVFFRADSLSHALSYLRVMAGFGKGATGMSDWTELKNYLDRRALCVMAFSIVAGTPIFSRITRDWKARAGQAFGVMANVGSGAASPVATTLDAVVEWVRLPILATVLLLSLVYIAGVTYNPFLYFRF